MTRKNEVAIVSLLCLLSLAATVLVLAACSTGISNSPAAAPADLAQYYPKDLVGVSRVCLVGGDSKDKMRELMAIVQALFDEEMGRGVVKVVPCGQEDVALFLFERGGAVFKIPDPACSAASCMFRLIDFEGTPDVVIQSFIQRMKADNPR